MAILQPGYVINAGNLISAFYQDAVSTSSQGNGAAVGLNSTVNFADGIAWGPASGSLSAQYPTSDAAWAAQFGGLGRAGNPAGNAWAQANVAPGDFKKTSQANLIIASNYSGNGIPTSTAYLYESARNFLSVNWCLATRYLTGGATTNYGPYKASFATTQGNIVNPIGGSGVTVSVGDTITIVVGSGGTGGAGGTGDLDGSAGGDGEPTSLSVASGTVLLVAGGAGGQGGTGSPYTGLVKGAGGAAGDTGGGGDGGQGGIVASGPGGSPGFRQGTNGGAPNGGTATTTVGWSTAYGGGGGGNPQGTGGNSGAAGTGYGAGGGGGTGSFGASAGGYGAGGYVQIVATGGTAGTITYTAPGTYTYTVAAGTTSLAITAVGGGGGGGGGGSTTGGNYNYQAVGGGGGGGGGGYSTLAVTIGTPLPADVPQYYIASADDNTADEWAINTYFNNLKAAFNSRAVTSVSITVCHSSCHSSCHGSRGRR